MVSRKLSVSGILYLVGFSILGGIVVGLVLFLFSKTLYLLIISPILASGVAGYILTRGVKRGKVRRKIPVFISGVLMALVAFGVFHYAEYIDFRRVSHNDLVEFEPELSKSETDELISSFLIDETESDGFMGFLQVQAQEGMSFTSSRRDLSVGSKVSNNLDSQGTVLYWLVEIGILFWGATAVSKNKTQEPYCEEENKWLIYEKIGYVAQVDINNFLNCLKIRDFVQASQFMGNEPLWEKHLLIQLARCNDYSPEATLNVRLMDGKNSKTLLTKRIALQQYTPLVKNVPLIATHDGLVHQ